MSLPHDDVLIATLSPSTRLRNVLNHAGIRTVGEARTWLARLADRHAPVVPNFGATSYRELEVLLGITRRDPPREFTNATSWGRAVLAAERHVERLKLDLARAEERVRKLRAEEDAIGRLARAHLEREERRKARRIRAWRLFHDEGKTWGEVGVILGGISAQSASNLGHLGRRDLEAQKRGLT